MAGPDLICERCGRRWPVTWQDRPGWMCRNTVLIDAARRFHGRPCMGLLAYPDPMSDLPPDVTPSPPDAYVDEHNYDAWIGRFVYETGDPEPIGAIGEIYYDAGTQRPEWIVLADSRHLVPIAGTTVGGDYSDLYLGFDRATIAGAPTVAPGHQLDLAEEQALYAYYGFDWDDPVPAPLPPRFDDGWDTGWIRPQPLDGG